MQLNNFIKNTAAEIGIDLCGITDAKILKEQRLILEKRKKTKYWPQAFTNQNIEELTDPSLHFNNLKSIISTAVSYNNFGSSEVLSNYITVKDYHSYLFDKLEELVSKIKKELNRSFSYKIFVDQAPFLEKAVAQRAGLGFIGKNTLLINPKLGSNLFLGEIFTDLDLKKDQPLNLDCGSCRLCLESCQVNALKDEYLLSAVDCRAYLTQKRSLLTEKEAKKIGTYVWGCDDCKAVCPFNKKVAANKAVEMKFFDKKLEYFLNLDRKNLDNELKETAMTWRGARILVRNALIAAANSGDYKYFGLVEEKLNDLSPIIRYYALFALAEINYTKAEKIIEKQIKKENNKKYKNKMKLLLK